jgi:hypothetical protein
MCCQVMTDEVMTAAHVTSKVLDAAIIVYTSVWLTVTDCRQDRSQRTMLVVYTRS